MQKTRSEPVLHLSCPHNRPYMLQKSSPETSQERKILAFAGKKQNKMYLRYKCLLRIFGAVTTFEETWQTSL